MNSESFKMAIVGISDFLRQNIVKKFEYHYNDQYESCFSIRSIELFNTY